MAHLGKPDFNTALKQHESYCDALRRGGTEVTVLPADPKFPDGVFVEDAAVLAERCAIITRPGAASRLGEGQAIEEVLLAQRPIERIHGPGTLDGGDVLRVENHFYIGLSRRTDLRGAKQLIEILTRCGYAASTVPVSGLLHLKSGVTYVGRNTLVALSEIADQRLFHQFDIISADAEAHCANCLLVNSLVLAPCGCPNTVRQLRSRGMTVGELEISEFQKMEGGLTCLSLLF